ncbi:MAG: urease accessory protein UreE [Acidiferrobacterales bacterium]|nr:urease accessory protein UreE [Acidiferrobacterales bacterium]
MWLITAYAEGSDPATHSLTLPFELRQKARLRAELDNGQAVGLQLERGKILRNGDLLKADNGAIVEVIAAPETVSTVKSSDRLLLARVCYHLGNRHVPLQIADEWCRYGHDHVLDEMVELLGAKVICEQAPFEPEAGAYAGGGHTHTHEH